MSTKLEKVKEVAKSNPTYQFHSMVHFIDKDALRRSFHRLRKDAAVGVDGVSKEEYGKHLEENIEGLLQRMKERKYRHQPIRRGAVPKEGGKTRPIGISTIEDKVVQGAVKEVLEAIYEQDFIEGSYGFRPKRGAHDAIRRLDQVVHKGEAEVILEADIRSFFDSIVRKKLMEMLHARCNDRALLRLVGKCLHVGVLQGEIYSEPEVGTVQGSIISPLLGNIYLHYALDLWFEREVKPGLLGEAHLIRYADDFIITFKRGEDSEKVRKLLGERMEEYGLELHEEKTRVIEFGRPSKGKNGGGKGKTFNFLGFTAYWVRTLRGGWRLGLKTRSARLHGMVKRVADWCRSHRHLPVGEQHKALCRQLNGHMNYFGVNGNAKSLDILVHKAERVWHKWLNRRSQRSRLNWDRFNDLLKDFPLPKPTIRVQIWGGALP